MNLWRSLLCFAVVLGLSAAAAVANNNNQAPDHSASKRLSGELTKTKAELAKALAARDGIATKIRIKMKESQEYKNAEEACRTTDAELKAAKAPVLEALAKQPAYDAALKQKAQADAARDKLSDGSPEKMTAAQAVMDASAVLTKLETDACQADAKVAAAQAAQIDALKKFAAVKKEVETNLRNDSEWQAASKEVTDKQAAVAKLDKDYDAAVAKERQAENAYQARLNQQAQQRNNRNNNNRKIIGR